MSVEVIEAMAVRHEGNVAGRAEVEEEREGPLEKVIVPAKILLRLLLLQSFSLVIQVVGVVVVLPVMDPLSD